MSSYILSNCFFINTIIIGYKIHFRERDKVEKVSTKKKRINSEKSECI